MESRFLLMDDVNIVLLNSLHIFVSYPVYEMLKN